MLFLTKRLDVSKFCETHSGAPQGKVAVDGHFIVATNNRQFIAVKHGNSSAGKKLTFSPANWREGCQNEGEVKASQLDVLGSSYASHGSKFPTWRDPAVSAAHGEEPKCQIGIGADELSLIVNHCKGKNIVLTIFRDRIEWHDASTDTWGVLMAVVAHKDSGDPCEAPLLRDELAMLGAK